MSGRPAPGRPDQGRLDRDRLDRETWVRGSTMLRGLVRDGFVVARAIREKRYADLHAIAAVARAGVSHRMAVTDPVAYRAIREGITLYHLKGYRCLDVEALGLLAGKVGEDRS